MEAPVVVLDGAGKSFVTRSETVQAVAGVSLSLQAGELVCLMGPSGCGKSTLLSLIAGLLAPDTGQVRVLGHDYAAMSPAQVDRVRLSHIGVVFQDHNLIAEFTCQQNIALPLAARGFDRDSVDAEVDRCLAAVGLPGFNGRYPEQLSGGQAQRVGIARALAGRREILVADEPTGALDSANSLALFRLLRSVADQGTCVVMATHDPEAAAFTDRAFWMRDGKIEAR